ncbi:uncharacterized protein LOC130667867 [Microplitis mediator]|uniref:uncharacterized protein LOC130667867 n=1 Tax=Microplitis mediator TaxID=375433 RepID=UPI0025566B56|nr:uncharacterized protein LOC130667867 [Microplitis mediator]
MASEIDENPVSQVLRHILKNLTGFTIDITATTATTTAITDGIASTGNQNTRRTRNISDVVVSVALVSSAASASSPASSISSRNIRKIRSRSMVAVAISDSVTIPTNPSMALNSTVVVTRTTTSASTTTAAKPDQHVYNSTNYLSDQDDLEYSILAAFSDMQTVFLACICTLLPLIVALAIAFGLRHAWRKYRLRRNGTSDLPWYRGVCSRDDTAESLHHRPHRNSISIQPATRILSAQDLVNGLNGPRYICETEVMEEVALAAGNGEFASPGNHTSKNANGNIITLTLKNNHLIVETEERAMTMTDNSFVVEVQPKYLKDDVDIINNGSIDDITGRVTDQQALVHREEIPEDHSLEFSTTKLFGSINTGLSQSDLSIASRGSVNHSYRYGNQMEYDAAQLGYMYEDSNYKNDLLSRDLEGVPKWVEFDKSPDTEKTLLNDCENSSFNKDTTEYKKLNNLDSSLDSNSSLEHQDSTDASNSTDTVRSNPNLQVNGATPNKLESMERKSLIGDYDKLEHSHQTCNKTKPIITGALFKDDIHDDIILSINDNNMNNKLGNGTLLSPTELNKTLKTLCGEEKPEGSVFVPCHKRTNSIPPRLIEDTLDIDRKKGIDIYSQIKTSILPGLTPKFELLQNEVSPIDEKES